MFSTRFSENNGLSNQMWDSVTHQAREGERFTSNNQGLRLESMSTSKPYSSAEENTKWIKRLPPQTGKSAETERERGAELETSLISSLKNKGWRVSQSWAFPEFYHSPIMWHLATWPSVFLLLVTRMLKTQSLTRETFTKSLLLRDWCNCIN